MSERPTPETDKAKCKFTSLFGDDEDAYWVPLKLARCLERKRDEAREEIERIKKLLLDPNAVRINMLHGKIDKLDWEKLEHIHGPHPARDQLAAERALADRLAGMLELYYADDAIAHYAGISDALTAWKEARSE